MGPRSDWAVGGRRVLAARAPHPPPLMEALYARCTSLLQALQELPRQSLLWMILATELQHSLDALVMTAHGEDDPTSVITHL